MKNTLIAITTFNQAKYTEKCFESLKHTSAKVICIDDASTDHTRKVCDRFNIEFIGRDVAMGLTHSWNLAYRYFLTHSYDYLIISNNDVLFPQGSLEQLVKTLERHPYVGVMTRRNEGGPWSDLFGVETYYPLNDEVVDMPKNHQWVQDFISQNPLTPIPVPIVYGFCFGINREIQKFEHSFQTLFDPANINVRQEKDLASRVTDKVLCRSAFVYHHRKRSFGISSLRWKKGRDPREQLALFHNPFFEKYFALKNGFQKTTDLLSRHILKRKPFRRPTIVLVVGMHRSGTSALSGTLHLSGISMGTEQNFIPHALPQNPKGFYENCNFRDLNDQLLKESGYDVKSWKLNLPKAIQVSSPLRKKMKKLIKHQLHQHSVWGWKDPRNCLTLKTWLSLFRAMDLQHYIKIIYIYRHPASVAKSLVARGNTDYKTALDLWRIYNLCALRALQSERPDAFYLDYEDLLSNPKQVTEELFSYLCVRPKQSASLEFLDSRLQHNDSKTADNDKLPEGIKEIFEELNRRKNKASIKCFF